MQGVARSRQKSHKRGKERKEKKKAGVIEEAMILVAALHVFKQGFNPSCVLYLPANANAAFHTNFGKRASMI